MRLSQVFTTALAALAVLLGLPAMTLAQAPAPAVVEQGSSCSNPWEIGYGPDGRPLPGSPPQGVAMVGVTLTKLKAGNLYRWSPRFQMEGYYDATICDAYGGDDSVSFNRREPLGSGFMMLPGNQLTSLHLKVARAPVPKPTAACSHPVEARWDFNLNRAVGNTDALWIKRVFVRHQLRWKWGATQPGVTKLRGMERTYLYGRWIERRKQQHVSGSTSKAMVLSFIVRGCAS
jgi:hypothetical protein